MTRSILQKIKSEWYKIDSSLKKLGIRSKDSIKNLEYTKRVRSETDSRSQLTLMSKY